MYIYIVHMINYLIIIRNLSEILFTKLLKF